MTALSTTSNPRPRRRAPAGRGSRRWTALGLSLALHGALFAGLSLLGLATFGGERVVRTARLALAETHASEPVPENEPAPEPVVDPLADAEPPEPVPVEPDVPFEASPEAPLPEAALDDLAALEPQRLPLQPLVPPAHEDPAPAPPEATRPAATSFAAAPPAVAGQDEDAEPVLLEAPEPRYPPIALRRGWQGTVVLRLWVAGDGRVADAAVEGSSGFAIFDDAALGAVRRWRFDAGRLRTVEVLHRVRFEIVAD